MLNDKRILRATKATWVALSVVCVGDEMVRFLRSEATPLFPVGLVGGILVWVLIYLRANAELRDGNR
jgi:hypothetical protein